MFIIALICLLTNDLYFPSRIDVFMISIIFFMARLNNFSLFHAVFGDNLPGKKASQIGCFAGHLAVPGNSFPKHLLNIIFSSISIL